MVKVHADPIAHRDPARDVIERVVKGPIDRRDLGDDAYRARGH